MNLSIKDSLHGKTKIFKNSFKRIIVIYIMIASYPAIGFASINYSACIESYSAKISKVEAEPLGFKPFALSRTVFWSEDTVRNFGYNTAGVWFNRIWGGLMLPLLATIDLSLMAFTDLENDGLDGYRYSRAFLYPPTSSSFIKSLKTLVHHNDELKKYKTSQLVHAILNMRTSLCVYKKDHSSPYLSDKGLDALALLIDSKGIDYIMSKSIDSVLYNNFDYASYKEFFINPSSFELIDFADPDEGMIDMLIKNAESL